MSKNKAKASKQPSKSSKAATTVLQWLKLGLQMMKELLSLADLFKDFF